MMIKKYVDVFIEKKKCLPRITLKGSQCHHEFLENYRDSGFAVP